MLDSLPVDIFSCATYLPSESQTGISQDCSTDTGKVSLSLAPGGSRGLISADVDSLTPPTTAAPEVCLITCEHPLLGSLFGQHVGRLTLFCELNSGWEITSYCHWGGGGDSSVCHSSATGDCTTGNKSLPVSGPLICPCSLSNSFSAAKLWSLTKGQPQGGAGGCSAGETLGASVQIERWCLGRYGGLTASSGR